MTGTRWELSRTFPRLTSSAVMTVAGIGPRSGPSALRAGPASVHHPDERISAWHTYVGANEVREDVHPFVADVTMANPFCPSRSWVAGKERMSAL